MKFTLLLAALAASAVTAQQGADIKEKLRQFRDPKNTDKSKLYSFVNDRHESRTNKLAELLKERREQMDHHESGHRKLSAEDHARVTRQITNFGRKLEQLKNMDEDDRKDMLQHEAESLYRMNSVEYLDFGKN